MTLASGLGEGDKTCVSLRILSRILAFGSGEAATAEDQDLLLPILFGEEDRVENG
jgi:hypothetical protein